MMDDLVAKRPIYLKSLLFATVALLAEFAMPYAVAFLSR